MGAATFYSSVRPNGAPTLESPRIEITAYGQFPEDDVEESSLPVANRVNSIVTLTLPSTDGYRDPSCLSPSSSISSRSGLSDASYESGFSYNIDNSPQNSPWQSPCVSPKGSTLTLPAVGSPRHTPSTSPRTSVTEDSWTGQRGSRPISPYGSKRKYSFTGSHTPHRHFPYSPNHSPGPSLHTSPRLSVTEDTWMPNTNQYTNSAILAAINALTTDGMNDLGEGIPVKARKTSQEHSPTVSLKVEPGCDELSPEELCKDANAGVFQHLKKEDMLMDMHPFSWSKPKQYLSSSLPALDWQLPCSSGPYSLQIEVQPRPHHRAHYETEGSRGAVKALAGGHPVVQLLGYMESEPLTLQLFIGTADDRLLRPHAFYQVHRITGKTVSTSSHEAMHNNTKVLEIPLLPENNMRAVIDCAGILKLRNSDIELRKGETDIGRKNTRVRMVFRVHIHQATGRTVSLQVSSNPIECSQRSAQELPLVEKQNLESCSALGGVKMLLEGHNFQHDSKVVFVEKAQDGHHLWESEAQVERDPSKPNTLLVEIPPYRTQRLSAPVHVSFYVCNGKRKRSQHQRFTYVHPSVPTIKTEPHDNFSAPLMCTQQGSSKPFYALTSTSPDPRSCVVGGAYPVSQQRPTPKSPSLPFSGSQSPSPKLFELSSSPYSKCFSAAPSVQTSGSPAPHVSIIQETSVHHHPPNLYPPNSSPPASQPSPPNDTPFSQNPGVTPPQPDSSGSIIQEVPRKEVLSSVQKEGSPERMTVSIKKEPQELDQIYLDDVNEIIRNDLSAVSVQSQT
ncbi:Nuclear factor of activated T-cells, cytoplasmic 1 [Oryzias melastigma]|uniref:Nuclear factor of activated T-cells, cytoplasmic 1 n=1 Tax=Oryzias melastigma TaxID=30732 RepID=A0A834F9V5_ORYME|nr:Nuclear factor of activated T-cells, cytoplasmic 1 [Oryzias melastigma]